MLTEPDRVGQSVVDSCGQRVNIAISLRSVKQLSELTVHIFAKDTENPT